MLIYMYFSPVLCNAINNLHVTCWSCDPCRVELAGVQEQYVKVCREKDELCRQLEGKSEGVPSEGVMKEWEEKKATTAAALEEVCLCTVIR